MTEAWDPGPNCRKALPWEIPGLRDWQKTQSNAGQSRFSVVAFRQAAAESGRRRLHRGAVPRFAAVDHERPSGSPNSLGLERQELSIQLRRCFLTGKGCAPERTTYLANDEYGGGCVHCLSQFTTRRIPPADDHSGLPVVPGARASGSERDQKERRAEQTFSCGAFPVALRRCPPAFAKRSRRGQSAPDKLADWSIAAQGDRTTAAEV